jgi:aldehyde:ferredoxin oxidoreductase
MNKQTDPLSIYHYPIIPIQRGYAGRTLHINLTNGFIQSRPVTEETKRVFIGGRGFCLWLLWNSVTTQTRWNDPENELVFACGPIGGILAYPGAGKVTVATLSPLTHSVVDSNGGGHFGPYLKFSGWDALEIVGKSKEDVIILIDGDNGTVKLESIIDKLPGKDCKFQRFLEQYMNAGDNPRSYSMVFTGQAADYISMCGLNITYYDTRRKEYHIKQCARGGTGRVFRDKRLAAIIVHYSKLQGDLNGVANPELIRKAGQRMNKEIHDLDAVQCDMGGVGTPYLVEVTNAFDLLPVENYRFGNSKEYSHIAGEVWKDFFDHSSPDNCWYGCTLGCAHSVPHFHLTTGPQAGKVVNIDGPEYETLGAVGSSCGIFDAATVLELNYYADTYGIDTISLGNSIAFAMECYEAGILNQHRTGGLELTWGNREAVFKLVHQMTIGQGFGATVGQGVRFMKKYFIERYNADRQFINDIGMEVKGLEISEYVTKESLAQQAGYGMALKGGQHEEACMVFMDQVRKELSTIQAQAESLYFFSLFRTWFSLQGLCRLPWNDITPESNKFAEEPAKFPEHIENYTWLYEGVTGIPARINDLLLQSERVYNFQRIFNLKMGFGTRQYDYVPYRAMGPVTVREYHSREDFYDRCLLQRGVEPSELKTEEKIICLRRYREKQYDKLLDEVYRRRGWTQNGIPTLDTIKKLGLDFPDVLEVLKGQ